MNYAYVYHYKQKNKNINPKKANSLDLINEKILDAIIDDNENDFIELISQNINESNNPKHIFSIKRYKMPRILLDNPTYASVCAFFGSEKCFSSLLLLVPEGIKSDQITRSDEFDRTLAHFACFGGNLQILREIDQAGINLSSADKEGCYPIHYSSMSGSVESLRYLWIKGETIFFDEITVVSPFHISCLYGHLDIIKLLYEQIANKDIETVNYLYMHNGWISSSLHLTCESGNSEVLKYLLSIPGVVEKQLEWGDLKSRTPLIIACQNGSLECVKVLINEWGAKIEVSNNKHHPLIDAAAGGFLDIVKFLVDEVKVDINVKNSNNTTALVAAITNQHLDVVKYLIRKGAMRDSSDDEVCDAFLVALGTVNFEIIEFLDSELNIQYGSDFNLDKTWGDVYMQQACELENEKLCLYLLSKSCTFDKVHFLNNIKCKWTSFLTFLFTTGINLICNSNCAVLLVNTLISQSDLKHLQMLLAEKKAVDSFLSNFELYLNSAIRKVNIKMINYFMSFNSEIRNGKNVLSEILFTLVKSNKKKVKSCLSIAEELLKRTKIDFNEEFDNETHASLITYAASLCQIDMLQLFLNYGATFQNCFLEFERMAFSEHIRVFNFLRKNGCLFKNATVGNVKYPYEIQVLLDSKCKKAPSVSTDIPPIYKNLLVSQNPKYDVNTLLFLIYYASASDLKYSDDLYNNLISVLKKFNCEWTIEQINSKLRQALYETK